MIATLKIDFYFERYLKNKFGQGFTILAKLDTQGKTAVESADIMDSFKKHIMTKFSGCVVKDKQTQGLCSFSCYQPGNTLGLPILLYGSGQKRVPSSD